MKQVQFREGDDHALEPKITHGACTYKQTRSDARLGHPDQATIRYRTERRAGLRVAFSLVYCGGLSAAMDRQKVKFLMAHVVKNLRNISMV